MANDGLITAGAIAAIVAATVGVFGILSRLINAHFRAWNMRYVLSKAPPVYGGRPELTARYRTLPGKQTICVRVAPRSRTSINEVELRFTNRRKFRRWIWETAPINKVEILWVADVDYYHAHGHLPYSLQSQRPDQVGGQRANYANYERNQGDAIWVYAVVDLKRPWAGRLHFKSGQYGANRYARQTFAVTEPTTPRLKSAWRYAAYGPTRESVHPLRWKNNSGNWQLVENAADENA